MKLTDLQQLVQQHADLELHIQSHHEGVYFTVEINWQGQEHRLMGQKDKPLVFRDEESARNLLQQAGVKQVKAQRILSRLSTLAQPMLNQNWRAQIA